MEAAVWMCKDALTPLLLSPVSNHSHGRWLYASDSDSNVKSHFTQMTYKHIFLLPLGGFGFIHPGFQTSSSTWRGNTPNNN